MSINSRFTVAEAFKVFTHVTAAAEQETNIVKSLANVEVTFELITPARAVEMLEGSNFDNRSLRKRVVEQYAGDMQDRRWKLTPEPIAFYENGDLFQGQHRLNAVIRAESPAWFMVVRRWPINMPVFDVLDSGAKRTVSDVLGIENTPNPGWVASVARHLRVWEMSTASESRWVTVAPAVTRMEILETVQRHSPEITSALDVATRVDQSRLMTAFNRTQIALAIIILSRTVEMAAVTMFFDDIIEGKLPPGDPRWLLLRYSPVRLSSGMHQSERAVSILIKCWNAYVVVREVKLLVRRSNEAFPSVSPLDFPRGAAL